jgi:hypothetical protein
MFGIDNPFGRGDVPAAVRTLTGLSRRCVCKVFGTVMLHGFGEGVRCTGRIQITILLIE